MNKKYSGLDVRSLQAEEANTPNNPAPSVSSQVTFVDSAQSKMNMKSERG